VTAAKHVARPLEAARERSRAQVARYHEIRAALEKLRVTARSADRSVTVEMAAGGAIVDLKLTQQAMAKTSETLAATILEAIRLGLAQVAERTTAEVEPLTGRRIDLAAIGQGRLPALSDPPATSSPEPTAESARFLPEDD
jgi:DNA-binding protein YbaB